MINGFPVNRSTTVASVFLVTMLSIAASCIGQVTSFVETFSGRDANGFDHPGWRSVGDSYIEDGKWIFENVSDSTPEIESYDSIGRFLNGYGSVESEIRLGELELSLIPMTAEAKSVLSQNLFLGTQGPPRIHVNLKARWDLKWVIEFTQAGINGEQLEEKELEVTPANPGAPATFSVGWDRDSGIVRVTYDNDSSDVTSPVELIGQFGPLAGQRTDSIYYEVTMATAALGTQHGSIDSIVIRGAGRSSGDYSANGELDVADINLLSELVKVGDPFGDLDNDGVTDGSDLAFWVHDLNKSYLGDVQLDGEFNSVDLVSVFQAGQYEDDIAGIVTWSTGDWNGDGDFTTTDLVVAFQDGGYEAGPRPAAVPEPSPMAAVLLVILALKRLAG